MRIHAIHDTWALDDWQERRDLSEHPDYWKEEPGEGEVEDGDDD